MFKTRLDTFGNDFGHFWNFEIFLIFLKIFEDSTLHGTLGKNFAKIAPKLRSELVWILMGLILCIFVILFFFDFFWKFSKTRPSMENWAENFRKISPITCSKHVWILLGTILDIFGSLTFFKLFWKFSKSRASMEHWAKKIFEKIATKHVQNTFGQFWERLWAYLEFWEIFTFFKI